MPDRVHLTATFKVKPGSEGKVLELLKEAQSETRKEKGCLKYDLIQDLTETNVFIFIEQWENKETLAAHSQAPHILLLNHSLPDLLLSPVQLYKCKFIS